jgi:hypothetical protein
MWNQSSDEITIIVTGKLAQADYFNMITKDNVLKVLKNINQNRFIKFDVQKLYESAIVECCDVTVNMKVKDKIENYYKAMSEVKVLDGFDLMPKASRNMLRIKSDAESRDEVLLCYDKYLEL